MCSFGTLRKGVEIMKITPKHLKIEREPANSPGKYNYSAQLDCTFFFQDGETSQQDLEDYFCKEFNDMLFRDLLEDILYIKTELEIISPDMYRRLKAPLNALLEQTQ